MQPTVYWVRDLARGRLAVVTRPDPAYGLPQQMKSLRDDGLDVLVSMLQPDEAIRHYKRALELDDSLGGAHYGVAFLLLKRGDSQQAAEHLRAFLQRPPKGPDAERWIRHAESALRDIASSPARETL